MAAYEPSTFVKNSITGQPTAVTETSITVQLGDEDIAFVLGKGGVTKVGPPRRRGPAGEGKASRAQSGRGLTLDPIAGSRAQRSPV